MAEQNKPTFYITTPIYYPSGDLHIGNSYSTILSDSLARYKRLMGYDVHFLTGTDEHGQKIQETAEELGMDPKVYVDDMAEKIKELWVKWETTHDYFIRTTDDYHMAAVQQVFEQLLEQGDIYLDQYRGWYSISDEEFFTDSQLSEVYRNDAGEIIGGKAPSGHEVELVEEESYFFKMSKYAERLAQYYEDHPNFLKPEFRKNEMLNNFIKPGLNDLAVSRTTFDWGIPVSSNPKHVVYVWIDALINYITALGYGSDDTELFDKYWPADVHVVGKDISRFHMIYWPTMLMALDLPLPKTIFAHGWLLMQDGKMSKSKGNVVYPHTLIDRYGVDASRYYLLREMSKGNDSVFTPEDFVERLNTDLSNDLGNLLNRTIGMINQYFEGVVPTENLGVNAPDEDLVATIEEQVACYHDFMDQLEVSRAAEAVMAIVSRTNRYIDETKPWVLNRSEDAEERAKLAGVMHHLAESLRIVALLMRPYMPQAPAEMFAQLGISQENDRLLTDLAWGQFPQAVKVTAKARPIFPRLDAEEEVTYLQEVMRAQIAASQGADSVEDPHWEPEAVELVYEETASVSFDEAMATEIKVAEVMDVAPVEGSDRLLRFRLDAGDKGHRQVLSGIAEDYPVYEELIGQKVIVITNLQPRKMMGLISQGMILSAETDEGLELILAPSHVPNGTRLS